MKRLSKTILFVLLLTGHWLLITDHSVYAAFQENDWGSRPTGMGGAFIGIADDTNAIVHNPGGLAQVNVVESNFMYARLYTGLEDVNLGLNYAAVGFPVRDYGTFGVAWANFSSMNEYHEDTFYLSYSDWIYGDIAGGISVKYLGHRYDTDERTVNDPVFASGNSKYSWTVDAGLYSLFSFESTPNTVSVGIVAKNLTQPDVGLLTTDKVPMEVGIGAAYNTKTSILPALDVSYRFQEWGSSEDKLSVRLGAETSFLDRLLIVRGGVAISKISFGFGVRPQLWNSFLQLDYAFIWPIEIKETQGTHLLSLTLRFADR